MKAIGVTQDMPTSRATFTHPRTYTMSWYALIFLVGLVGLVEAGDFLYETDGTLVTITGYTGPGGAITIPASIDGKSVTSIGDYSFTNNVALTAVAIPNSVTNIGYSAFEGCAGITNLTIPPSVAYLGYWAFAGCHGLTHVDIPPTLNGAGNYAFAMCNGLENVNFDNNAIAGNAMFWSCTNLTHATFGNSVTSIGGFIFGDCSSLADVSIPDGVEAIGGSAFARCTSLRRLVLPSSITYIDDTAFVGCTALSQIYFLGDAPDVASFAFFDLPGDAVVCWMPGTSGWSTSLDGVPTVVWNPHVGGSADVGVSGGVFGFMISGSSNLVIVTEASSNLLDALWIPVSTNVLINGSSAFQDPSWSDHEKRFYRFRAP